LLAIEENHIYGYIEQPVCMSYYRMITLFVDDPS